MGSLSLVWAGLWRRPARTLFTVASLAVGFALFGLLQGVNSAFDAAMSRSRVDRLLIDPRFDAPLIIGYADRIGRVPGVTQVAWTNFVGSYYQDPRNNVLLVATDPARFFDVRPEMQTTPAALKAMQSTRTGIIVFDSVAARYGWKVGDHISLLSSDTATGVQTWTFEVVGTLSNPSHPGGREFSVINYDYLNEARSIDKNTVTRFVVRVADPRRSAAVGHAIDTLFASSPAPTLTLAENEFAGRDLATIGDVGRLTRAVIVAVFLAMLFLAGNVIRQSVRERSGEFAVLKTIGFSDGRVMLLVALEALLVALAGAVIGLAAAALVFPRIGATMGAVSAWLAAVGLSSEAVASGLGAALVLTVLSAALPAWGAGRLKVTEALRVQI